MPKRRLAEEGRTNYRDSIFYGLCKGIAQRTVTTGCEHLSSMEDDKKIGAEVLLRIVREFGKRIEWLLTG